MALVVTQQIMPHQVSYVNEATLFQLSFAFAEEISVPTIDTNSNGPLEASYCHSDGNKKCFLQNVLLLLTALHRFNSMSFPL